MRVLLVKDSVEIDGEGGGVPMPEVHRVSEIFRELFRAEPTLRIVGHFGPKAFRVEPGGDESKEAWDLRLIFGSGGFGPVIAVGDETVWVQGPRGLNHGRALVLLPYRGTLVRVRLSIPKK